jgi:hypothetical protein
MARLVKLASHFTQTCWRMGELYGRFLFPLLLLAVLGKNPSGLILRKSGEALKKK